MSWFIQFKFGFIVYVINQTLIFKKDFRIQQLVKVTVQRPKCDKNVKASCLLIKCLWAMSKVKYKQAVSLISLSRFL